MSGLLDKAKAKEEETSATEVVAEIDSDGVQSLTEVVESTDKGSVDGFLDDNMVKVTKGAGIVLAIAAVYMFWNLKTIEGIYALGALVISYALFNLDNILATETDSKKLLAMGAVWLMLGAVPYGIGFGFGEGNVTISGYEFDEFEDKISYQVFSSAEDEFDTWITFGDETVWEESISLTNDRKTVNVDLDEFYQSNSLDYDGDELKYYTIHVKQGDVSGEYVIDDENAWDLTRNIDSVGVQIIEEVEIEQIEDEGPPKRTYTKSNYMGIAIQIKPGLSDGGTFNSTDGTYKGESITTINSDYDLEFVVTGGKKWADHPTIKVDGDSAVWDGGSGNPYNGWMFLSGTTSGEILEYLERDEFFTGDGCYSFTSTLTHDIDDSVVTDAVSYYISWEQNESDDDNTNDIAPYNC